MRMSITRVVKRIFLQSSVLVFLRSGPLWRVPTPEPSHPRAATASDVRYISPMHNKSRMARECGGRTALSTLLESYSYSTKLLFLFFFYSILFLRFFRATLSLPVENHTTEDSRFSHIFFLFLSYIYSFISLAITGSSFSCDR